MPLPEWYNENENRDYPLVEIPDSTGAYQEAIRRVLLDAGFFVGSSADIPISVTLEQIDCEAYGIGKQFKFRFEVSHEAVGVCQFVFTRTFESPRGETEYASAVDLSPEEVPLPAAGLGFLATGDISVLDLMEIGTSYAGMALEVEPALVQVTKLVNSVNLANDPGPAVTPCGETPETPVCLDPPLAVVMATGLVSDVAFKPGYNAIVNVQEDYNRVELAAGIAAGEGEPCGDVSREPSSSVPDLDHCDELIYTVNRVAPTADGNFTMRGDRGVYVQAGAEEATVEIVVDSNVLLKNCGVET